MITFTIPMKPFSINASYTRDARYKTKEFKAWELEVLRHLNRMDTAGFSRHCAGYEVHLNFIYPLDVYYTAQGKISARTMDLSNKEKLVLDLLFNRWLGVDDRFVTTLISTKGPGADYAIEVTVLEADAAIDPAKVV